MVAEQFDRTRQHPGRGVVTSGDHHEGVAENALEADAGAFVVRVKQDRHQVVAAFDPAALDQFGEVSVHLPRSRPERRRHGPRRGRLNDV